MQTLSLRKSYKKYPEYKDSGVEWLGNIPSGWDNENFKTNFKMSNERLFEQPTIDTLLSVSGYRGIERKDISLMDGQMPSEDVSKYRVVRKNQLVVNTMWLNFTGLGVSNCDGYVSPAYRSYNISKRMYPKYIHYLMRSKPYVQKYTSLLYGIRPNSLQVKPYDFEKIEILVPKKSDQKKIADYLDEKTSFIDQIIEKKKKLIELLKEKRTAIIQYEVVCQPEDNKQGIKTEKIKHLIRSIDSGVWGENPLGNSDDIKCLRVADFDYENLSFSNVRTFRNNPYLSVKKLLKNGDILVEKSGGGEKTPVGRAILFKSDEKMVCANFIDIVRVNKDKIVPDYLVLYLSVLYSLKINTKYIKQNTGIQNIDVKEYFGELVSFPNIEVQKLVVASVYEKMKDFDRLIWVVEKSIEKLQEFKSSLISNVVTGKVKI